MRGTVSLRCGCKINLFLEITGVLPDGYHSIRTYMLPLDEPHDTLKITFTEACAPACHVICSAPGIDPCDNTLTKAYTIFAREFPSVPAIEVELLKGVPQGSGLGGGSADAAALLLFLNAYARTGLNREDLLVMACRVGADVPFFILNTPAWATGIGDKLEPDESFLLPFAGMSLVLLCPNICVSTPWAYSAWDELKKSKAKILTSAERRASNNTAAGSGLRNVLEVPVFSAFPQLADLKKQLYANGAEAALMSGSGSGVFGLFFSQDMAEAASVAFRNHGLKVYTRFLYAGASPSW